MRHFFYACFIFTLFHILPGCSTKSFPTGNYQQIPVTVDGDLSEWDKPIRFVSNGGQVLYNVTNDNVNIYVGLETHDETTALKMLRAGIIIYIDPSGGQNKAMSLAFPLANTMPLPAKNITTPEAKAGKNDLRETLLIQAISFMTTGFKNMENRLYDASDKSKIKVAIRPGEKNSLGYEAIIPLEYIFGNGPATKNNAANISVGIVINAIKGGQNYQGHNNSPGSGRHGGGGRGRGMGGSGSSRRNNGNGTGNNESADANMQTQDRTALFKEDANWYKFKLAVNH